MNDEDDGLTFYDFEDGYPTFHEFSVMITKANNIIDDPIIVTVWAAGLEEAMDCGEILSGVYLDA